MGSRRSQKNILSEKMRKFCVISVVFVHSWIDQISTFQGSDDTKNCHEAVSALTRFSTSVQDIVVGAQDETKQYYQMLDLYVCQCTQELEKKHFGFCSVKIMKA